MFGGRGFTPAHGPEELLPPSRALGTQDGQEAGNWGSKGASTLEGGPGPGLLAAASEFLRDEGTVVRGTESPGERGLCPLGLALTLCPHCPCGPL